MNIPYITATQDGAKHLNYQISGSVLDTLANEEGGETIAKKVGDVLMELLTGGGGTPFDLDCILVCGGGSRSPVMVNGVKKAIQGLGGEAYEKEKLRVVGSGGKGERVNIEDFAVFGATLLAAERKVELEVDL